MRQGVIAGAVGGFVGSRIPGRAWLKRGISRGMIVRAMRRLFKIPPGRGARAS